jgi:hypothetical protein
MADTGSTRLIVDIDSFSDAPSFQLLSTTTNFTSSSVDREFPARSDGPQTAIHVKTPDRHKELAVFVNASFAASSSFSALVQVMSPSAAVNVDETLEADVLLSARTAAIWLSARTMDAWMMECPERDPLGHPQVRSLLAIFKHLVIAVESRQGDPPGIADALDRLQQLPNAKVLMRADRATVCEALHRVLMYVYRSLLALIWHVKLTFWYVTTGTSEMPAINSRCRFKMQLGRSLLSPSASPPRWTATSSRAWHFSEPSRVCRRAARCL